MLLMVTNNICYYRYLYMNLALTLEQSTLWGILKQLVFLMST